MMPPPNALVHTPRRTPGRPQSLLGETCLAAVAFQG
jgi:hypothetical protein